MTNAIGPEALDAMTGEDRVYTEIERINAKMTENRMDGILRNTSEFTIILGDNSLSLPERQDVVDHFETAGWCQVLSHTSGEKGERPGLICYTFFKE